MKAWQKIGEPQSTKIGYRTIVSQKYLTNNGHEMVAYVTGQHGTEHVAVIALTANNQVVIARQFRCGPQAVLDELAGGVVDEGETPEQAANRELLEETGYSSDRPLEYIGSFYCDAWNATLVHGFLARDCKLVGSQKLETAEEVEVDLISTNQLVHNALNNKMTDANCVLMARVKKMI